MASHRTVVQLKDELKKRGLSTKGVKAELEARLQESDSALSTSTIADTPATVSTEIAAKNVPPVEAELTTRKRAAEPEQSIESTKTTTNNESQTDGKAESKRARTKNDDESNAESTKKIKDDDESNPNSTTNKKRLTSAEPQVEDDVALKQLRMELDKSSNSNNKSRVLLDYITRVDARDACLRYLRSSLHLFSVSSSNESPLFAQETCEDLTPQEARHRYFERAGVLQRICFQLGRTDLSAFGSPSQSVQFAIENGFFLSQAGSKSLFRKAIGAHEGEGDDDALLVRALTEYFGTRKSLMELCSANESLPNTETMDAELRSLLLERSSSAVTPLSIARLVFLCKMDLVRPPGRSVRRFTSSSASASSGEDAWVLARTKGGEIRLSQMRDVKKGEEICVMDTAEDKRLLLRLEQLRRTLMLHSQQQLRKSSSEATTLTTTVDFGPNAILSSKMLHDAFPGEIDTISQAEEGNRRFVVSFNKRSAAALPTLASTAVGPLTLSQVRALRTCLIHTQTHVSGSDRSLLVAQLIATLFVSHPRSRILVLSSSETTVLQVLKQARERSDNAIQWRDMIVPFAREDTHQLSPSRTIARYTKERAQVLSTCLQLAKDLHVDDPDVSAKSCDFASYFLIQASRSTQVPDELRQKVDELKKFELFSSDEKRKRDFLVQVQCRIVGAVHGQDQSHNDDESGILGRFDFVIADDVSSVEAFVCVTNSARESRRRLITLGDTDFQAPAKVVVTLDDQDQRQRQQVQVPGFYATECRHLTASLKEEAEFVVSLYKFARKLGYADEDLQVFALTGKHQQLMDDLFAAMPCPKPCALSLDAPSRRTRLVFVAVGGKEFSQEILQQLEKRTREGLVLFSCDKKWMSQQQPHQLELVLGERVGEDFDMELREGTRYVVSKPADIVAVLANM